MHKQRENESDGVKLKEMVACWIFQTLTVLLGGWRQASCCWATFFLWVLNVPDLEVFLTLLVKNLLQ